MTPRRVRSLLLALAAPWVGWAATGKPASEVLTPSLRQGTVDLAVRLTRSPAPEVPPADVRSPFSPPDFERLTPEEAKLAAAKGRDRGVPRAPSSGPAVSSAVRSAVADATGPTAAKPVPASDREILEQAAARIPSTGVIVFGAQPLLVVGGKRYAVGSRFTVTLAGQDYEVVLVAIDRLTFTLRYRGEQYARPVTLR